jgi:hypothetical protein
MTMSNDKTLSSIIYGDDFKKLALRRSFREESIASTSEKKICKLWPLLFLHVLNGQVKKLH